MLCCPPYEFFFFRNSGTHRSLFWASSLYSRDFQSQWLPFCFAQELQRFRIQWSSPHLSKRESIWLHIPHWHNYIKSLKFQFQRRIIFLVIAGCYLGLLWTSLPVFRPVILLGCAKTPCLHTAINEWHPGMPLRPAATYSTFIILIIFKGPRNLCYINVSTDALFVSQSHNESLSWWCLNK